VLLVALGGALLATAASASASTATITFSPGPTTGYTSGQLITANGSGFTPKAQIYLFECSLAPDQPTITVLGQSLPVSCTPPIGAGKATSTGTFKQPLPMAVITGVTGPPATGNDSAGNSAATDAINYPCPQYANQTGGCVFRAFDSKGVMATDVPIAFDSSVAIPTTTTTVATCAPAPATQSSGGSSITLSQATCLSAGTIVSVSGSGFTAGATAAITECSSATGQPNVSLAGDEIPVSCSNPILHVITVSPSGSFTSSFTIMSGTVGPPVAGVDSAGNQASVDAAKYQCPSDVATGAGCAISFGDSPTQSVSVPITFLPNNPGQSPPPAAGTKGGVGSTAPHSSMASATKTSTQALAFTGAGSGLRWMAAGGVMLLLLGGVMLAVADQSRRISRRLLRHVTRRS